VQSRLLSCPDSSKFIAGSLFLLLLVTLPVAAQSVRVNEAQSAGSTLLDRDGETSDWIELLNTSSGSIGLAGYGLTDDPTVPFKWPLPDLTLGAGEYLVVYASGKNDPGLVGVWESVLTRGDVWKYSPGSTAIPANWTDSGFDDSRWLDGPSGFGYGDGDDATQTASILSLFARTSFTLPDTATVTGVQLHVDYDDSFVAYVNGVEVGRANIGVPGVPVTHIVPANGYSEARLYQGLPISGVAVDRSILVPGENVVAIQVHNSSRFSSDLSLIPFLSVGTASASTDYSAVDAEVVADFPRPVHTSFKLSSDETVCLTSPDGAVSDCLQLQPVPGGSSMGLDAGGAFVLFSTPTPGGLNAAGLNGVAPEIQMSPAAGVYPAGQSVSLTSPSGGRIRYTLDGSVPNSRSLLYLGPIQVNETVVVRARAGDAGMLPGSVSTRTYAVLDDSSLPVVSITTEPDALFHPQTGLYVDGPGASTSFPHFGANFWEDREIVVHLEWLDGINPDPLGFEAGLKIYGGWSRGHPQKSMSLFARGRYGASEFRHRFFEDRPYNSFQSLVLRNSGNDWSHSMLRDGFQQTLTRNTEIDRLAYRPTRLYVNGDYWGIQNLREKISEHYLASISGVSSDLVDLIEFRNEARGAVAIHGTTEAYDLLLERVSAFDIQTPEAFAELSAMMDMDNYIDYQIAQIYFDNRDWPGNNSKAWRPRTDDGKFRWILYDTDFGWGIWNSESYRDNTLLFATAPDGPGWPNPPWSTLMLRRLLENSQFRTAFLNRFADFLNVHFSTRRVFDLLTELVGAIKPEIERHEARWELGDWDAEIAAMQVFGRNRPAYMMGHLQSFFGVSGVQPVTVDVDGAGGKVRVNRELVSGPWTGDYFRSSPLEITAIPRPGYQFVDWTGTETSTQRTVTVRPTAPVSLVAHFEPAAGDPASIVIHEIQYNPANSSGEWVELVNTGSGPIDLAGWRFGDDSGEFTIPDITLPLGGYAVLCENPDAFQQIYGYGCIGSLPFKLGNGGDGLFLTDAAGVVADSVRYSDAPPWPSEPDGDGWSLELKDPLLDNADPRSWRPSTYLGGSPQGPNSIRTGVQSDVPVGAFELSVYPNPVRGAPSIQVALPEPGELVVEVFDTVGRRVSRSIPTFFGVGRHTLRDVVSSGAAGVYLVRIMLDGVSLGNATVVRLE
jgi:uncharacterized repeat protein (TIGR02543 family)